MGRGLNAKSLSPEASGTRKNVTGRVAPHRDKVRQRPINAIDSELMSAGKLVRFWGIHAQQHAAGRAEPITGDHTAGSHYLSE